MDKKRTQPSGTQFRRKRKEEKKRAEDEGVEPCRLTRMFAGTIVDDDSICFQSSWPANMISNSFHPNNVTQHDQLTCCLLNILSGPELLSKANHQYANPKDLYCTILYFVMQFSESFAVCCVYHFPSTSEVVLSIFFSCSKSWINYS